MSDMPLEDNDSGEVLFHVSKLYLKLNLKIPLAVFLSNFIMTVIYEAQ